MYVIPMLRGIMYSLIAPKIKYLKTPYTMSGIKSQTHYI